MSNTAWIVSQGAYSDYEVLAVALTRDEAQRYADAYNAARDSLYRDDAGVEEVDLYRDGDPLPRGYTGWNADRDKEWRITQTVTGPDPEPQVSDYGTHRGPIAMNYPTREEARAAIDNFTQDHQ